MVKIFIGNVAPGAEEHQLRGLFEEFGPVSECAVVGNYAFVHMDEMSQAERAIQAINGKNVNGNQLSVELSHGKKRDGSGGPMRGRGGSMNGGGSRGRGGPPRSPMGRGGSRGGPPGFRPRPWETSPYGQQFSPRGPMGPPSSRGGMRGGPPPRGMAPRGMAPPSRGARFPPRPPGPPRGGMRGRGSFGPRPPPPMYGPPPGYMDDGSGMMYPAGPEAAMYDDGTGVLAQTGQEYYAPMDANGAPVDPNMAPGGAGEYDYYGAVPPSVDYSMQDPNMVPAGGMVYDNYSTAEYTGAEAYDQSAYYGEYAYDYSQDPNFAAPAANGVRYNPYATQ